MSKYLRTESMKFLVNRLINTKLAVFFRNTLKIKPVYFNNFENLKNSSISDIFCWRTDSGYVTKFKFSDILNLFFESENSWVEVIFFDKENNFLKKIEIKNLNISNEIIIDKKFLNGIEDYGTFYIYHFCENPNSLLNETIINRCYTGFSRDKQFYSFVHGNTLSKYKKNNNRNNEFSNLVTTSYLKNHYYKIQKKFSQYDKNELIFSNPTNEKIRFSIDNHEHFLDGGCSKKLSFSNKNTITIKTDCLWLRPVVFSYKNSFFDVHHS